MARLTQQGRVIDVNHSFGRLVGRPAAERIPPQMPRPSIASASAAGSSRPRR
jgi:hypothetical protein